jgi:hypothetical protein
MDKHNEIPDYFHQNPDDNKEDDFTPTFEPIIEGLQDDYDPDVLDLYLSARSSTITFRGKFSPRKGNSS